MNEIKPNYYNQFKCIANRCQHSCCIGWEIEIDEHTLEKYQGLKCDFASRLKSNIELSEYPHFKLDKNDHCLFLNNGLCDIIANLGEDMLCQICSDHPRFRNYYEDFTEIGLGLTCEEAARIILSSNEKAKLDIPLAALEIPVIQLRERIFNVLQDRTLPIDTRVCNMLNMVGAKMPQNVDWYQVFKNLERLDNSWDNYLLLIKDGIDSPTTDNSLDTAYEQLVSYLLFRHFTDCLYDDMLIERVLFCALIYKIVKKMNVSNTLNELIEIARMYSCEIEYSDQNIETILSELN